MNRENNIIINSTNNDEDIISIEKKFLDCTSTYSKNFGNCYMENFFEENDFYDSDFEYLRVETNKRTIFICGDTKRHYVMVFQLNSNPLYGN